MHHDYGQKNKDYYKYYKNCVKENYVYINVKMKIKLWLILFKNALPVILCEDKESKGKSKNFHGICDVRQQGGD